MWLIHVLAGSEAILFLLQDVLCIASFICIEVVSLTYGHDRTGTTSWVVAPYLVGYASKRHIALHSYALEVICHQFYLAVSSLYIILYSIYYRSEVLC
jgi:hypothetical protein